MLSLLLGSTVTDGAAMALVVARAGQPLEHSHTVRLNWSVHHHRARHSPSSQTQVKKRKKTFASLVSIFASLFSIPVASYLRLARTTYRYIHVYGVYTLF
jgi:hypothetical protein